MRGRRQYSALQHRGAPAGFHEMELPVKLNLVRGTQSPVQVEQIIAATQQNMLAVVDDFFRLAARRP